MKFFMPIGRNEEEMKKIWGKLHKLSNPNNHDKYTQKVYSVTQVNDVLELVYYDKVDGNFPDAKFPIVAIVETENSFDIYGAVIKEINGKEALVYPLHSIRKNSRVVPEYFEE